MPFRRFRFNEYESQTGRIASSRLFFIGADTSDTCAMIKTGKVYENMMINLRPSNIKLRARTIRIVQEILGCDEAQAIGKLEANDWSIRRAVAEKE